MHHAANGRLIGRRGAFPPDPDDVDDRIAELSISVGFDATLLYRRDPGDVMHERLWMKIALSRYGRVDMRQWASADIREMRDAFEVLVEILKSEGANTEDR